MKKVIVTVMSTLFCLALMTPAEAVQTVNTETLSNGHAQTQKSGKINKKKTAKPAAGRLSKHNQAMSDVTDMKAVRQQSIRSGASQR